MPNISDNRHIANGWKIPSEGYCDQPYVVKTDDGAWLCIMTTGTGREGQSGQHIVATRSTDRGRTWSDLINIEPADGPEASYAVVLKVPSGRIYAFYNHNTDNVRQVKGDNPPYKDGYCKRVDSLGHFVFKYSDDHGHTWSTERYDLPVREMAIDRENADGGTLRYFWNVGKTITDDHAAYISLHKVGGFGEGFFTRSEGVLLKSENILTESDPSKITWETLPNGDAGLRTPPGGGTIAEEQSYSQLSDGSFYCVYRTIDGHPACTYSRDGGHTWAEPTYKQFNERDKQSPYGTGDLRQGFSIDLWLNLDSLNPKQILLDNRLPNGQGLCLQTTNRGTIEIVLNDGRTENRWDCDPEILQTNTQHHIAIGLQIMILNFIGLKSSVLGKNSTHFFRFNT